MRTKIKHPSPKSLAETAADSSIEFLMLQYAALREEILKRMEVQNQIISLMFIASGTLISVGLQFKSDTVMLATPILAMFLATFWANHDVRIRQIGLYIRRYIEEEFLEVNKGWEGIGGTSGTKHMARQLSVFASQGIFIGTQVLSVLLALLNPGFKTEDIVLLIVDVAIILFTLYMLRRRPVEV